MDDIELSAIIVEDRQRKTFDEIEIFELAEDIHKNGLIHALVVTPEHRLIVGERRLRALRDLARRNLSYTYMGRELSDAAPCAVLDEADPIKLKEIELSENLNRQDLTWQEKAAATKELHELRAQQNNGTQTITDTAREAYKVPDDKTAAGYLTAIREDLLLADALDDPEIARAPDKKNAMKLLRLKAEAERNAALAREYENTPSLPHKLIHGEAIEEMKKMPSGFVDVILTDPPYGIGAHTFGKQTTIRHKYDDSKEAWEVLMKEFAREAYRVTKTSAHAYVFCDIRRWPTLSSLFAGAGWDVWSRPLIWYKGNVGTLPRPDHGPRLTYEAILFANKGAKPCIKIGQHDVLSYPTQAKPRHAAEKPISLYSDLLSRSARPNSVVLDSFCGSGTIFPAANRGYHRSIGIELDEVAFGIASSRLNEDLEEAAE